MDENEKNNILEVLLNEQQNNYKNGLYHYTQIDFAYNSNHIEGSSLNSEQTQYIFEKDSFLADSNQIIKTNDILEAKNHFKAFDFILKSAQKALDSEYLKKLHSIMKKDCSDISIIGDFKTKPNFIGNTMTTPPNKVAQEINTLLESYYVSNIDFNAIVDFHYRFEKIHPFADGNGRVGRLIMFKECLKYNIVPFIIDEEHRFFYYRGLKEYSTNKGYLIDTCLSCQDKYKEILKSFEIEIEKSKSISKTKKTKKDYGMER